MFAMRAPTSFIVMMIPATIITIHVMQLSVTAVMSVITTISVVATYMNMLMYSLELHKRL